MTRIGGCRGNIKGGNEERRVGSGGVVTVDGWNRAESQTSNGMMPMRILDPGRRNLDIQCCQMVSKGRTIS